MVCALAQWPGVSPSVNDHPTLIIVSHRPEILRRADHILVLREGMITAQGTLAELLPINEEIRAIWVGADAEAGKRPSSKAANVAE